MHADGKTLPHNCSSGMSRAIRNAVGQMHRGVADAAYAAATLRSLAVGEMVAQVVDAGADL